MWEYPLMDGLSGENLEVNDDQGYPPSTSTPELGSTPKHGKCEARRLKVGIQLEMKNHP